ncbi:MAG: BA14K family protein [Parvibaculaceae bacterium]
MRYKPLAVAAAAVLAGMLSFGSAQAANVMTGSGAPAGITKMQDGNVQTASHRKWRHRWRGNRWHRHRRSGVFLGLGFAPFYSPYYSPYYEPYGYYAPRAYYAPRGSRHVRWCLNRYRSYDPRSNTFMGYDGDRHRCRSPYRY